MVENAVAKNVVPGVGEEPKAIRHMGPNGAAFGAGCAFADTALHFLAHLRSHVLKRDIADSLFVCHRCPSFRHIGRLFKPVRITRDRTGQNNRDYERCAGIW